MTHENRLAALALAGGLPAVIVAEAFLFRSGLSVPLQWTLGALVPGLWIGCALAVRERTATPLRTFAGLLEALREGDYSVRARGGSSGDALSDVTHQINMMAATLRDQRLGALEATTLLRKVIEEIDVAIFAFDYDGRLKLVNPEGERLIGQPAERALELPAHELGLGELLTGEASRTLQCSFAGASGRWGVSRSSFREGGLPHHLLVLTDLTRALREEELQAWQRIVRVLGHELNNSLTPIKSIAESLSMLLRRKPRPEDLEDDLRHGLDIISTRSGSLSRFLGAYATLAKLPPPRFNLVEVNELVRSACAMETRLEVGIEAGPHGHIPGDRDQLEQVLINLIRNAADAALDTRGKVSAGWTRTATEVTIRVLDEGPGLAATANLFVPFFTTKPGGSGIGLVLSRQIVEAHSGSLILRNRQDRSGCEAVLTLPV